MNKITVLLSTYNGERYLREQLDSILNQQNIAVSLLVRDDGSHDATLKILREYASRYSNIKIYAEDNIGFARSFSKLIAYAMDSVESDYFAFCDQDDVWLPEKLFAGTQHLTAFPENRPALYCSNLTLVTQNLEPIGIMPVFTRENPTRAEVILEHIGTGCTMVFNQAALRKYQQSLNEIMQNPDFRLHDRWMFLICFWFGKIFIDSKSYILYRQHGNNAIGANSKQLQLPWRYWSKMRKIYSALFHDVKLFCCIYGNDLSPKDFIWLMQFVNYRKNRLKFFLFLLRNHIKIQAPICDLIFKLQVLLGKIS